MEDVIDDTPTAEASDVDTLGLPTVDRVREVFSFDEAVERLLAEVEADQIWREISGFPEEGRHTVLGALRLARGAKYSKQIAGQVLRNLRSGDLRAQRMLDALAVPFHKFLHLSHADSLAVLRGDVLTDAWNGTLHENPSLRAAASAAVGVAQSPSLIIPRLFLASAAVDEHAAAAARLVALAWLGDTDLVAKAAFEELTVGIAALAPAPPSPGAFAEAMEHLGEGSVEESDDSSVEASPGEPWLGSVNHGSDRGSGTPASGDSAEGIDERDEDADLAAVQSLIASAVGVADHLRCVADLIGAGQVSIDMSSALDDAGEWVRASLSVAVGGGDLTAIEAALRHARDARNAEVAARAEELAELVDLRDDVMAFNAAGKAQRGVALLQGSGWQSLDAIEERIGILRQLVMAAGSPGTPDFVEYEVGPATDVTVDARDKSGHPLDSVWESDSDVEPEPESEVEPATETPVEALLSVPRESGSEAEPEPEPDRALELTPEPVVESLSEPPLLSTPINGLASESEMQGASETDLEPAEGDLAAFGDPWSDGRIANLVSTGRYPLAVVVAEACGIDELRTRALRVLAGAFGCASSVIQGELVDVAPTDLEMSELDVDSARVLLAGAARLALSLGYPPLGSLDKFYQRAQLGASPLSGVIDEVTRLARSGYRHETLADIDVATPDQWRSIAERAHEMHAKVERSAISYTRVQRILRHLASENRPLGKAMAFLAAATERSGDEAGWSNVEDVKATLHDLGKRQRMIDGADRAEHTKRQFPEPIQASARDRLKDRLDAIEALLDDALELRGRAVATRGSSTHGSPASLVAALDKLQVPAVESVGDAALAQLIEWLRAPQARLLPGVSLDRLIDEARAPLVEIPRDADGRPVRPPSPDEVERLIAGRPPAEVVIGYLERGNRAAAEQFDARYGGSITIEQRDAIQAETAGLRDRLRNRAAAAERLLGRLRALNADDAVRDLHAQLEALREAPTDGRFDLAFAQIDTITRRASSELATIRKDLDARVGRIGDEDTRTRIGALLSAGNEPLAVDFITRIETGADLPSLEAMDADDFAAFYPAVVNAAAAASAPGADVVYLVRRSLGAAKPAPETLLARRLRAWESLGAEKRGGRGTTENLAHVMRLIGLVPPSQDWIRELTRTKAAGYGTWAIKARPIDRSYVPLFGSGANGTYDVTAVWHSSSPARILDLIEKSRRDRANIILYFGTLSADERMALRRRCASEKFSPILIDDAVIAWLSTRPEQGLRITQRITLPFTTINPFTPFARGEVPDEMFVGRDEEQAAIRSATGSMFVYGGRQLGKSALLRKVERIFQDDRSRFGRGADGPAGVIDSAPIAIYIDLNAEGVSAVPDNLWPVLGRRLEREGIVQSPQRWTADSTIGALRTWLADDDARRAIVLLDEADDFLTADSRAGTSDGGAFPVFQRLKGLMQDTGGRFKPVFAGLHQVQRFHNMPETRRNAPTAHGGTEILVGPLRPTDAAALVENPLRALGYAFESQETVWRLLLLTNYQASLTQIIGEALVRHMLERVRPTSSGGRFVITDQDVDDVYARRDVRGSIQERFRWTLNLDNRYFVVAMVTALLTIDGTPGEAFSAEDIRGLCEDFWAAGFDRQTLTGVEYRRYLSELVGLGVLRERGSGQAARYGLASHSILGLLGTREDIEADLAECDAFEVDAGMNQTMNRRVIGVDARGIHVRSPLSDGDLTTVLSRTVGEVRGRVIVGSMALGVDRVVKALSRAAEEAGFGVDVATDTRTLAVLVEADPGRDSLIVVDLSGKGIREAEIAAIAELVRRSEPERVVLVLEVSQYLEGETHLVDWEVLQLHRWSELGLKCLQDTPFTGAGERRRLREATSGWPHLVERAVADVIEGEFSDDGLNAIAQRLGDPTYADAFLDSVGVDRLVVAAWAEMGPGPWSVADIAEITGRSSGDEVVETLRLLDALDEASDGWILDRLVMLAAGTINSAS